MKNLNKPHKTVLFATGVLLFDCEFSPLPNMAYIILSSSFFEFSSSIYLCSTSVTPVSFIKYWDEILESWFWWPLLEFLVFSVRSRYNIFKALGFLRQIRKTKWNRNTLLSFCLAGLLVDKNFFLKGELSYRV